MRPDLQAHLDFYKRQHRTTGCKLSHLLGVPLIFISFPTLLINWRTAAKLFAAGWGFQFIGHFIFEKNRPVLFSGSNPVLTALAAAIVIYDGWARLLTGRPLVDEDVGSENDEMLTPPEADLESLPAEVIELQKRVYRRRQAL